MNNVKEEADRVNITYYTDPLCCWSWALEPQWRKLQLQYGSYITWKYKMGGLLPDWKTYHDPEHSVSRPIQMGPIWMHAAQISGMPMNSIIWMTDPPASSYPACIAFKCVEKQNLEAAEMYLRLLREAVMIEGKNIANKPILIETAEKISEFVPAFDIHGFERDLVTDAGIEAFRKDLVETQSKRVERFPTLIFRYRSQAMIMTGYQPYNHIIAILEKLAPALSANETTKPSWLNSTEREIQEYAEKCT